MSLENVTGDYDTTRTLFQQKGLVRMRDTGVGAETVARMVRAGVVVRVARGLYPEGRTNRTFRARQPQSS